MSESAQQRYEKLKPQREDFLSMARRCAALTIPSILPPEGLARGGQLPQPYQSLGSRGVVNLSSRIMSALYPPGLSSFRLTIPAEKLMARGQAEPSDDENKDLVRLEKTISREIERSQWRKPTHTSLQYLLVTGNALEHIQADNTIRVFRIDQYVVVRDPSGNLVEGIVSESLSRVELPDALKGYVSGSDGKDYVTLYTWFKLQDDGKWSIQQEIGGQVIEETRQTVKDLPYIALRWTPVIGEAYGRGKCEEHIADLTAYDALVQAGLEGASMASMHLRMIRPNAAGGLNLRRRLEKARNGDTLIGNPEDVAMLQFENVNGLQITYQLQEQLRQELSTGFLLTTGATRDAERVTAYEISKTVDELEGTLGGAYSMLSQEMQAARLKVLIKQMVRKGQLPQGSDAVTEPVILTGLEALGREQDVQRVQALLSSLQGLPPEIVSAYVKWPTILSTITTGLQLPDASRTDAEAAQMRQQMLQEQATQQAMSAGGQEAAKRMAQDQ